MMNRCALCVAGLAAALACASALAAKKPTTQMPDVAFITNTSSTNTSGYRVEVLASGDCGVENNITRSLLHKLEKQIPAALKRSPSGSTFLFEEGKLPPPVAQRLFRDIKAAMPLNHLPAGHGVKSVSFGTSTYIEYKRQRTPDLTAPADAREKALLADITQIAATLHLKNSPRGSFGSPVEMMPVPKP